MRLVRYQTNKGTRPGVLDSAGILRDLGSARPWTGLHPLHPKSLDELRRLNTEALPVVTQAHIFDVPLAEIGKIIGVGLNYRQHAVECGLQIPSEPTLFLKATTSLAAPNAPLVRPIDARAVDWEVELAVVIGTEGVYIKESEAMNHVAGYCLAIDFSEREFQFNRLGQGFKGKSCDSFGPLGPWFVTADEIPDPHRMVLELEVNHMIRQRGNTADMIFAIPELISYISRFMRLKPGDTILTGTPAGVGMGASPATYLNAGDHVHARGEQLGTQSHVVRDFTPEAHSNESTNQ